MNKYPFHIRQLSAGLLFLILIASCKKSTFLEGYTRSPEGYYFKLLSLGDGNINPFENDVVVADAVMKTQKDSVFWDTFHDGANGLYIDIGGKRLPGSCKSYLSKLVEGDSLSFLINPTTFFREYFDTIVPYFCQQDSLVKIDLKITEIISKTQYLTLKKNTESQIIDDTELQELQQIESYLLHNYELVKPEENGIYYLEQNHTGGEKVESGKRIKINFSGCFLDGKPIGKSNQEMEYVYGTPDQTVKGLNIVIGKLKQGESAKIIVPSRLAFGEKGSSNGSVPPFTPIVFNIKIIDIK